MRQDCLLKRNFYISLGNEIKNFFDNPQNISKFRLNFRPRSLDEWSEAVVYKNYINLYNDILNKINK